MHPELQRTPKTHQSQRLTQRFHLASVKPVNFDKIVILYNKREKTLKALEKWVKGREKPVNTWFSMFFLNVFSQWFP